MSKNEYKYKAIIEFECGSDFQAESMLGAINSIMTSYKIFWESKHKKNKVKHDIIIFHHEN